MFSWLFEGHAVIVLVPVTALLLSYQRNILYVVQGVLKKADIHKSVKHLWRYACSGIKTVPAIFD